MELAGAFVVILTCILSHFWVTLDLRSFLILFQYNSDIVTLVSCIGVLLLAFPFLGYVTDVHFTRYKAIKVSLLIQLVCSVAYIPLATVAAFEVVQHFSKVGAVVPFVVSCCYLVAVGLYDANAIQFGLDQLLGASSSQLSRFIHWFFWSQHAGKLALFSVYIVGDILIKKKAKAASVKIERESALGAFVIRLSGALLSCFVFFHCNGQLYKEKSGINPFLTVSKVLKYAWKHKHPMRRSAFTYWEEDMPSRIDLGKDKYGGPFTTEEVEDVKTFLRLLLLLISMCGIHFAGDGFSVAQHMEAYSCPSLITLSLVVINPLYLTSLVVLSVMLFWKCLPCRVKYIAFVNMLKRMGLGLLLLLLQEVLYTVLISYRELSGLNIALECNHTIYNNHSTTENCLQIRTTIDSKAPSDPMDNMFLWLIGPQILNGLAQLLVNMTALEFICAQSPHTLQGLLIGLWYAIFSIKYLIMSPLDILVQGSQYFYAYQSLRTFAVLISVIFFICVAHRYKYRVRDDVVPEQWLIEDVIARRIDQEEEFWRQRQALLDNSSSSHAISR